MPKKKVAKNKWSEKTHAEKMSAIYSALGEAITQWQAVEERLFALYCLCTGAKGKFYSPVSASYHSISGFLTRLTMVDYALRVHLTKKNNPNNLKKLKEWETLKERIRKKSKKRNNLAHYMVITDFKSLDDYDVYIRPNYWDIKPFMDSEKPKTYTAKQIKEIVPVFGRLSKAMGDFTDSVKPLLPP